MKRNSFFSLAAALLLPLWAMAQGGADLARKMEALNAYPDLIVVNGKISTMDAGNREVQAMAVKNGRVVAMGTNDEIRFLTGAKTEIVDVKGRRVLPGLIDGHTHPHMWAPAHWLGAEGDATAKRYNDPQLKITMAKGNDSAAVLRALEQVVQQRSKELGPGKWILAALFGGNSLSESRTIVHQLFPRLTGGTRITQAVLTTDFLDKLAPQNPIYLYGSEAIGPGASNTAAQKAMREILNTEIQGSYAGATGLVYDILFRDRTADAADFLKRELLECVSAQGVTTYGNHYYGSPSIMKIHNYLMSRGELPVRWGWWVGGGRGGRMGQTSDYAKQYQESFYHDLGDFRGIGNDYIWNAGVSNEGFDSGLICTKAKPKEAIDMSNVTGYGGLVGPRMDCDQAKFDYENVSSYIPVKAALEAGLRIGFLHGYSDGSYDALFHMLDKAIAEKKVTLEQVRAMRISTEHNPIIRPDQVKRMAYFNMTPSFNGYQVQGDIKGGAFLKTYGEQFMTWMAPMKSLVSEGAHPVFNTDVHLHKVPVEWKDMDYPAQWDGNIWAFIEFFVTRRMPHDGITYNRNEAMDRVNMMRAATIWGAEQLLNEKNIGSLETGKLADFIVTDKDFFTVPEDQIHTIQTLLTSVGGKVWHKSAAF
ncbi:MAG: hypothetical protein A3F68_05490 [Acidobacteria bacterium RIFCSPLOWO2_12_FULL_54_10]|nr:MAG: hypothetical protein A3F68_05490 [Acidobacteria bacterium RIFCSPLOWO2_12_FULL_54_10]